MRISRQRGTKDDSRVRMTVSHSDLWRERLTAPAYQVGEAARYARTTAKTIGNWQRLRGEHHGAIAPRGIRMAISYLQLIEIGVVAAMRKSGVTLPKIRQSREYLRTEFNSEFPFSHYRLKTDGKMLFMDYDQIVASDKGKLLSLNEHGQLAWNEILSALLQEFEYDPDIGMVLRWKVDGIDSPVRLDPRISFGAPQVNGIATWVLSSRWESGESLSDIASDYELSPQLVSAALRFEGIQIDPDRANQWTH
jgi:uncharacterized protein (DUF433 family)